MIKIAICEDNRVEQKILERLITQLTRDRNVPCDITLYSCGEELLREFEKGKFELIFLDIYMSRVNGIETGKRIRRKDVSVELVYCTCSRDFVMAGYEVFALGYLLKPYEVKKIADVLDYFLKKHRSMDRKHVLVKSNYSDCIISYKDIVSMESLDKIVMIHTLSEGDIKTYQKLSSLEEKIQDPRFLRCYQSYIVNMDYIEKSQNDEFVMKNGQVIPIRKREKKKILEKFQQYLLQE